MVEEEEKSGAIDPDDVLRLRKNSSESGDHSRKIMGPFELPNSRT